MVQYIEHDELVDELFTLENFSPEERLSLARQRRQEQLKLYNLRESKPELYPNFHASHNKNIRFDKSIELIESSSRNDFREVEELLTNGVSPDLQNEDGLSALHQAVIEDCREVVETLIKFGANLNIKDADLWTPLHAAVACSNYELISFLIEKGASLVEINTDGNMPIDLVEDIEEIEMLLDKGMLDAGYDEDKLEDIRNATANVMLRELREHLHNAGDLNIKGEHGETPMHIASANGYDEVVEYLLDHGAKIDMLDNDEWQPIHAAACWGHDKIIEILVNHGADLDAITKDGETPFDLTEDEDLQGMIIELKESGTKTKELKRSQSNSSRTLSVRRTSIVEKHRISVNDAKQEGIFRQNPDFLHVVISTGEENEDDEKHEKTNSESNTNTKALSELEQKKGESINTNTNETPSLPQTIVVPLSKQPTKVIIEENTTKQSQTQPTQDHDHDHTAVQISPDQSVKFNKEEKITIETLTNSNVNGMEISKSIDGQEIIGTEGKSKTKADDAAPAIKSSGKTEDSKKKGGKEELPVVNANDIDVELGETHSSHNTAAVKQKNKQLTESTDISVKKKCCTIL